MRYAIFSDIHGNLPAWEQVLADIRNLNADVLICLGDVVGYGPKPQEVLDGIRAVTNHFVMGNHDAAAVGIIDPAIFNEHAHAVVLWTREALNKESLEFLNTMPLVLETPEMLFVHAEVPEPGRFGYIRNEADASESFVARKHFVTFVGHTHYPECFERLTTGAVRKLGDQDRKLDSRYRYIVNVGSVGEPRDAEDIRARYVLYDDETKEVYFRRIDFDPNVYRDQLRATTLGHVPYFIRVLEDQAAEAAEVQDMEVLEEAVTGVVTARQTLHIPKGGGLQAAVGQPAVAPVKLPESSSKAPLVVIGLVVAMIGGLIAWIQLRGSEEDNAQGSKAEPSEVISKDKQSSEIPKEPVREMTPVKPAEPVVEKESRSADWPKPVFALDAHRQGTWKSKLPNRRSKYAKWMAVNRAGLRTLLLDGKDDFFHAKPVLKKGDDTFTYIALFRPLDIKRSQVIMEQAGKGAGLRASMQLTGDKIIFNGEDNDSITLAEVKEGQWQLVAMILNGQEKDNVIGIHNSSPPVFSTIDMEKQNVGNIGFRIGHKVVSGRQSYRGQIAEVIVYDQALSSEHLKDQMEKLQKKWGISFGLKIPEMEAIK